MKQIWPNYSYSPTTNVLTLTGLNIDRDQLLLVTAADRGRIMYNFADSSVTASAFTSGVNTALTLVATTAGLTTTAALVIYYDDQLASTTVTVSSLPSISGTVTANGGNFAYAQDADTTNPSDRGVLIGWRDDGSGAFRNTSNAQPLPISGTVTANGVWNFNNPPSVAGTGDLNPAYGIGIAYASGNDAVVVSDTQGLPISGTVTANLGSAIPAGTNRIGVVTIGAGTVTLGASTAQIGSVTVGNSITIGSCVTHGVTIANTSVTVNGTFFQATQPVSLTTLPALVAGTAQIGSVTASISNTAVTVYPAQGTTVTNSNFTSLTSSTSLVSAVVGREVLTVFNEGAGNLHISPGATCTTIAYQVRLSSGDYWECPSGQLSLAHTAVFSTAGTARVTEVS